MSHIPQNYVSALSLAVFLSPLRCPVSATVLEKGQNQGMVAVELNP